MQFDRSVKLALQGSSISSDGGLLLHRELDDALNLTDIAAELIADPRTGRNGRHRLAGLLRQSLFSRLAGYEDVNDADRLCRDPVMRQLVGGRAVKDGAASASAMGRFETQMLTRPENLAALTELPGRWIDAVHDRRPPKSITLDMDSSESPVHGDQEGSAWNGHFQSKCLHPLFVFNQFGDLERCALRPGNVHSADGWEDVLRPVLARHSVEARPSITRRRFRAGRGGLSPRRQRRSRPVRAGGRVKETGSNRPSGSVPTPLQYGRKKTGEKATPKPTFIYHTSGLFVWQA
jgi:hypothetical protein